MKKASQEEIHNRVAPAIVTRIITSVMQGDPPADEGRKHIMVMTESIIVGVASIVIDLGGDDAVLDVMLANAKERLAVLRLKKAEPAGTA